MSSLRDKLKNLLETFAFVTLTLLLYFCFILTVPIFRDPHGLLVMNDLSTFTRSGSIKILLFFSACVCGLLGAFLLSWAPQLTTRVIANLWVTTFFFIWADSVLSLVRESKSYGFLTAFVCGLLFMALFFMALGHLGSKEASSGQIPAWKIQAVHYWLWGWMGFYFSLSGFLVFNSFNYSGFHLPLAIGALLVCFLNYLLSLFLQKTSGRDVGAYSNAGRWIFSVWFISLTVAWMFHAWLFR